MWLLPSTAHASSKRICEFLLSVAHASAEPLTQSQLLEIYLQLEDSIEIQKFVKDVPVLVYELRAGDTYEKIPEPIRENLGKVDFRGVPYDDAYISRNLGGAISLQYSNEKPDFYIIEADHYHRRYSEDSIENVQIKNKKMWLGLTKVFSLTGLVSLIETTPGNRVKGVRKEEPVRMIPLSRLGFAIEGEGKIIPSWGGSPQIKYPNHDAFLVIESGEGGIPKFYMVNIDPETKRPIGYIDFRE